MRNRRDAQAFGRQCTEQANVAGLQAGTPMEQHFRPHARKLLQQWQRQACNTNAIEQQHVGLGFGQRLAQAHAQPWAQQAPQMAPFQRPLRHMPFTRGAQPTAQPATQQQPVADTGIGTGIGQHLPVHLVDGHVGRTACPHHVDDVHGVSAPLPFKPGGTAMSVNKKRYSHAYQGTHNQRQCQLYPIPLAPFGLALNLFGQGYVAAKPRVQDCITLQRYSCQI